MMKYERDKFRLLWSFLIYFIDESG